MMARFTPPVSPKSSALMMSLRTHGSVYQHRGIHSALPDNAAAREGRRRPLGRFQRFGFVFECAVTIGLRTFGSGKVGLDLVKKSREEICFRQNHQVLAYALMV